MTIHLKPDLKLKLILKYHKHPRILIIKEKRKSDTWFSFSHKNRNQDMSKASQDNGMQPVLKENPDIFSSVIFQSFNYIIAVQIFSSAVMPANIVPVFKKW